MPEHEMYITMTWFTLLDWSEQIGNGALLGLIKEVFPEVWASLDVGSVTRSGKKTKYKSTVESLALPLDTWERIEWYGGAASKVDPEAKWQSYVSMTSDRARQLIICSSIKSFSLEKVSLFVEEASGLGNLGYGFGDDFDQPGLTYYISGITFGFPDNEVERQKADRLSRWFSERLPMGRMPPKKRYLQGMYRGVYQINVLNQSHVAKGSEGSVSLNNIGHRYGKLTDRGNDNYVWSVPTDELAAAEAVLVEENLIV